MPSCHDSLGLFQGTLGGSRVLEEARHRAHQTLSSPAILPEWTRRPFSALFPSSSLSIFLRSPPHLPPESRRRKKRRRIGEGVRRRGREGGRWRVGGRSKERGGEGVGEVWLLVAGDVGRQHEATVCWRRGRVLRRGQRHPWLGGSTESGGGLESWYITHHSASLY